MVPRAASQNEMLTRLVFLLHVLRHNDSLCELVSALSSCMHTLTPYSRLRRCIWEAYLGRPRGRPKSRLIVSTAPWPSKRLHKLTSKLFLLVRTLMPLLICFVKVSVLLLYPSTLLAGLPRYEVDAHCMHHWYHRYHSFPSLTVHRLHRNMCATYRLLTG